MNGATGEQTTLHDRKRRAGQRLIVGFQGANPGSDLVAFCREVHPAGFIIYGRNIEEPAQLVELNRELSGLIDPHTPPLLTVDQEGGLVSRVRETSWPSARALGEYDRPEVTREVGAAIGAELRALGFHLDWAPVADIGRGGGEHADRAFSDDRDAVARHAVAFAHGLHDAGIIAAAKHFPGHGEAGVDSHKDLGAVDKDPGDLLHHELVPFRAAVDAGLAVAMTAHVLYPCWDERLPASLSARVVREQLRGELGFRGVVVSDDLEMAALLGRWSLDDQLDRACRGTTDAFIVGSSLDAAVAAWETLVRLQEADKAHDDLATDSSRRLMALRRRFLAQLPPRPDLAVVGSLPHRMLAAMVTA